MMLQSVLILVIKRSDVPQKKMKLVSEKIEIVVENDLLLLPLQINLSLQKLKISQ